MNSADFSDSTSVGQITELLSAVQLGDETAAEDLFAITVGHLRRMASSAMQGQSPNHMLQPTALVSEAVLRMLKSGSLRTTDNHRMFFGLAARVMRTILVDYARQRNTIRRNHNKVQATQLIADTVAKLEEEAKIDLLALDEALERLGTHSKRQRDVVVMKFFGGFSYKEIAEELNVSASTVEKDWAFSKAWLRRALGESDR